MGAEIRARGWAVDLVFSRNVRGGVISACGAHILLTVTLLQAPQLRSCCIQCQIAAQLMKASVETPTINACWGLNSQWTQLKRPQETCIGGCLNSCQTSPANLQHGLVPWPHTADQRILNTLPASWKNGGNRRQKSSCLRRERIPNFGVQMQVYSAVQHSAAVSKICS